MVKSTADENVKYAQLWLDRASKDFQAFKRIIPFDRRTRKPVRNPDAALATYLLQQSIEKAVKALAIASGQYHTKEITGYYKHNSLGLIMNLMAKITTKMRDLGLNNIAESFGINLVVAGKKIDEMENQIMVSKKADFIKESLFIESAVIDQLLDIIRKLRSLMLELIRSAFNQAYKMKLTEESIRIGNLDSLVEELSSKVTADLRIESLSDAGQINQVELVQSIFNLYDRSQIPVKGRNRRNRIDMITSYLGVWSFSTSLYLLTYMTFAHESTARYPANPQKKNKLRTKELGCNDYDNNIGIVNRIGPIGYVTELTLNDIRNELKDMAKFFSTKSLHLSSSE